MTECCPNTKSPTSPQSVGANNTAVSDSELTRRNILFGGVAIAGLSAIGTGLPTQTAQAQQPQSTAGEKNPNFLVIMGDDIGQTNISAYAFGVVGYKTPNIDGIAKEGMMFTDYYAENSCTAGRLSFITGQTPKRTGLSKVGIPGALIGLQARDITIAQALKPLGYATGQFGKNHLGDRNEFLPAVHGLDEFFGNLYHLNAEEEPERPYWPKEDIAYTSANSPRGVLRCKATDRDDPPRYDHQGPAAARLDARGWGTNLQSPPRRLQPARLSDRQGKDRSAHRLRLF